MSVKVFQQGDFLFREGDPVDAVYRLRRGAVEIMRERHAAAIVLGAVEAGQALGEMGVLEGRRVRSASARAANEVEAELVVPETFLDEISRSPERARELIGRLSQRLHDAEDRIVDDEQPDGPLGVHRRDLGGKGRIEGVTMAAATPELERQLGGALAIESTPFLVGRAPLNGEPAADLSVDVELWDHGPLRLSRNHFAIIQRDGRLAVRDLRSTLGTTVNGRPIGEHFASDEAPLRAGDNEIIAGGVASPFVFKVQVAASADKPPHKAAA